MKYLTKALSFQTSKGEKASKERILVVDDELQIRDLFVEFLGGTGYEVVTAENGEEALEKFKPRFFDCIISDFSMPGMDGLELLKRIKDKDPNVIFLMITGYPSIKDVVKVMKLGAYDYITKPLQLEDLQIKVERALYTRNLESSIKAANERLQRLLILLPVLIILGIVVGLIWK